MFWEELTWGAPPEGFVKRTDNQRGRWIVRQDREREINFFTCLDDHSGLIDSRHSGRARLRALRLSDGETALIRPYHHGGVFRSYTGAWFFTWPPRPFRELAITEELRRRGIRTVEVYAAGVSCGVVPFYRGWLVVRELADSQDLWTALQSGFLERVGRPAVFRCVAPKFGGIPSRGGFYPGLHPQKIFFGAGSDHVVSFFIDFY